MDRDDPATLRELFDAEPSESLNAASLRFLDAHAIPTPSAGADPQDPWVSAYFILTMAAECETSTAVEPLDPGFAQRFAEWVAVRPSIDPALGQLPIDAASCLSRARAITETQPRTVLAVGDDDAVSLALVHLGVPEVAVVDLDPRLLERLASFTDRAIETHVADFFHTSVPEVLRRRFDAVITDPFRDLDGGIGFLCFAAACVKEGGRLYWVDHPAWNFEHREVRETMARLGWEVTATYERLHRYELALDPIEIDRVAEAVDLDRAWLDRLLRHTRAVSHLYRLEKRGPPNLERPHA